MITGTKQELVNHWRWLAKRARDMAEKSGKINRKIHIFQSSAYEECARDLEEWKETKET